MGTPEIPDFMRREVPRINPKDSRIEREAWEFFSAETDVTEERMIEVITAVFAEICGEHGRQEFFGIVLPAVRKVYGARYKEAGIRLLDIIEKGANRPPAQIDRYFRTVIPETDLIYAQRPKAEILEEITQAINDTILEKRKERGSEAKGIVAAIIIGSFVKGNFTPYSDIDIIYIIESDEGMQSAHFSEISDGYASDFKSSFNRKIKSELHYLGNYSLKYLEQLEEAIKPNGVLEGEPYLVVSPYSEIKDKVVSA